MEIASICTALTTTMETNEANSVDTTTDFPAIIADLKHDIASIAIEMREKFNELCACPKPIPFQLTPFPTWIPLWTSVGLPSNYNFER